MKIRAHFLSFALFSAFFFNLVLSQETTTENTSDTTTTSTPLSELPETKIAIWFATLTTVFVGGLGDKTFLIAAFMSMKFPPLLILIGASGALTIILGASAAFGAVVPELIPPSLIHIVIIVLFFFFGAKFLYEAYTFKDQKMHEDQEEVQHQIEMVESKLMRSSIIKSGKHDHDNEVPLINLDNKYHNHPLLQIAPSVSEEVVLPSPISPKVQQFDQPEPKFELEMVNKRAIIIEIFSMVFLAEWGDRSQIYTIALASQYNGFIVFLGAILGHIASLIVAIIGGRLFAERISERTILFVAGILYILLGIFTIID